MRETMTAQSGLVVCLNASKADIRERLAENAQSSAGGRLGAPV